MLVPAVFAVLMKMNLCSCEMIIGAAREELRVRRPAARLLIAGREWRNCRMAFRQRDRFATVRKAAR